MEIRRLPTDEAAVRRYVEELWLPYHRDLEATVEAHALADDVDLVAEETAYRLGRLGDEQYRAWVAVAEDSHGDEVHIADIGGELAGFVTAQREASPSVFDSPDRVVVGDIYVRDPYRGTGLARDLVASAETWARKTGCDELALDVDVDNARARAFYRKLGFETTRHRMNAPVGDE